MYKILLVKILNKIEMLIADKMEIYARIPHLALIPPTADLKEPVCISMAEHWSVMG